MRHVAFPILLTISYVLFLLTLPNLIAAARYHRKAKPRREAFDKDDDDDKYDRKLVCLERQRSNHLCGALAWFIAGTLSLLIAFFISNAWGVGKDTNYYQRAVSTEQLDRLESFARHWEYRDKNVDHVDFGTYAELHNLAGDRLQSAKCAKMYLGVPYSHWLDRIRLHAPYGYSMQWLIEESPLSVFHVPPQANSPWLRPWHRESTILEETGGPAAELAEALLSGDITQVHAVYDKHLYSQNITPVGRHHLNVALYAAADVIDMDLCAQHSLTR